MSEAEAAEVRRRLILGLGLAVAVGGFALVPTEKLQAPPAKPLFFYLVPLLRVRALLQEAQSIIPVGDYEQLRVLLSRIEGPPNNVQENLRNAAASLSSSRDAEAAEYVARDVYEYIKNIDYQTYYDTPNKSSKELFTFSQKSAAAADSKLKEFLSLMPKDQVEAAQEQIAATAMAL